MWLTPCTYTYSVSFVGSSTAKPNQYKIWQAEKADNGLYRLTKPLGENVLTRKMVEMERKLLIRLAK